MPYLLNDLYRGLWSIIIPSWNTKKHDMVWGSCGPKAKVKGFYCNLYMKGLLPLCCHSGTEFWQHLYDMDPRNRPM